MYIYESHMGGFYATNDIQEDTYCETCGDYDQLLGQADTLEEAWKLLEPITDTFDDAVCETCPHNEDYEYCDNKCENWEKNRGYSLYYVMDFLSGKFENMDMVYLIAKYSDENSEESDILACDKVCSQEFGYRYALPCIACIDTQYTDMLARSLRVFCGNFICENIHLIANKGIDGHMVYVYTAELKTGKCKPEGAWYCEDGWWASFPRDVIVPATQEIKEVLKMYDACALKK